MITRALLIYLHKVIQKDSLYYLFADTKNSAYNLMVDLKNNRSVFINSHLLSQLNRTEPAFFRGDSLYYYNNNALYSEPFSENILNSPFQVERLFFDQRTLLQTLLYRSFCICDTLVSYLWITYQRMRAPRLVRGGIRNNFDFYPLREEEEQILGLLQSKLTATTEDIMRLIGRDDLSSSQNNKRKADAIIEINKLMKQLVGKTVIKTRKDPADKRQVIYYYKRNILN